MNEITTIELPKEVPSQFLPGTKVQWAWDSTCISTFKTCPRLYQYLYVDGWASKDESLHLRFGSEFHLAQQDYSHARVAGETHSDAMREAVAYAIQRTEDWKVDEESKAGRYKNRESLIRTIVSYFDHYANDQAKVFILKDGGPATELSFRFELDWGPAQRDCPVCGGSGFSSQGIGYGDVCGECGGQKKEAPTPYLLCGHLDKVVDFGGNLFVMDYKTTKSTLSDYYFNQFEPNNQMTLYTLASRIVLEAPVKGVIVDGIQMLLTPPYNAFERRFTYRTPDQLDEWLYDLEYWLNLAESFAEAGYWPMNDLACDKYGGCDFREVCSKSPQARPGYLRKSFVQLPEEERWNPLKPR